MKAGTFIALISVLAFTQARELLTEEPSKEWEKPWFCHDLDCPKYKVLKTTDKYEIREYEGASWVLTTVESIAYSFGITEGFKRLFDYISGENEGNKKIEMTSPVVTRTVAGQGPFCKSNFTTAFYLPEDYQDKPLKPTNPNVRIGKSQKGRTAVLQFGGYVAEFYTISHKIKLLEDALIEDNVKFNSDTIFSCSYDPPFRLQHRHNEIQIEVELDESDSPIISA